MLSGTNRTTKLISTLIAGIMVAGVIPVNVLYADETDYQLYPLSISYEENSSWNNCTQGQFTLTNESGYDITDWTIEIAYSEEITVTDIWNAADITEEPEDTITVSGISTIYAGQSATFGLIVEGETAVPEAPLSITLIDFEDNSGEIPTEEITPTPTDIPVPDGFPFALFSGSSTEDLTISGWQTNIEGDIYEYERQAHGKHGQAL